MNVWIFKRIGWGEGACQLKKWRQLKNLSGTRTWCESRSSARSRLPEREFFIDNLLVRIHSIIVMIRWTGLAPWELEFPFPGSLTSAFLVAACHTVEFAGVLVQKFKRNVTKFAPYAALMLIA